MTERKGGDVVPLRFGPPRDRPHPRTDGHKADVVRLLPDLPADAKDPVAVLEQMARGESRLIELKIMHRLAELKIVQPTEQDYAKCALIVTLTTRAAAQQKLIQQHRRSIDTPALTEAKTESAQQSRESVIRFLGNTLKTSDPSGETQATQLQQMSSAIRTIEERLGINSKNKTTHDRLTAYRAHLLSTAAVLKQQRNKSGPYFMHPGIKDLHTGMATQLKALLTQETRSEFPELFQELNRQRLRIMNIITSPTIDTIEVEDALYLRGLTGMLAIVGVSKDAAKDAIVWWLKNLKTNHVPARDWNDASGWGWNDESVAATVLHRNPSPTKKKALLELTTSYLFAHDQTVEKIFALSKRQTRH